MDFMKQITTKRQYLFEYLIDLTDTDTFTLVQFVDVGILSVEKEECESDNFKEEMFFFGQHVHFGFVKLH